MRDKRQYIANFRGSKKNQKHTTIKKDKPLGRYTGGGSGGNSTSGGGGGGGDSGCDGGGMSMSESVDVVESSSSSALQCSNRTFL